MVNRISRQEVSFGMTVPETGDARTATVVSIKTVDGTTHRLACEGVLLRVPAGPATVTVETTIVVAEPPPPPPSLRERLVARLADTQDHGLVGQAEAVLELLGERPNLLAELEALLDEDD